MLFKLSSLQHQLSESVAATELDKTSRQYTDLAVKYQAVLQKMAAQNVAEQQVERLQVIHSFLSHVEAVSPRRLISHYHYE